MGSIKSAAPSAECVEDITKLQRDSSSLLARHKTGRRAECSRSVRRQSCSRATTTAASENSAWLIWSAPNAPLTAVLALHTASAATEAGARIVHRVSRESASEYPRP